MVGIMIIYFFLYFLVFIPAADEDDSVVEPSGHKPMET
jgi:hypothetical protein